MPNKWMLERDLNYIGKVNVEFSRLPELDFEGREHNLEFVEQLGIPMQKNLNKYGSTVGLEFAINVTVRDELVAEFAVQKKWNTLKLPMNSCSGTRLEEYLLEKNCRWSSRIRCCRMVSRRVEHSAVELCCSAS